MLLSRFIREASTALEGLYGPREAREIVLRLVEGKLGVQKWKYIVDPDFEIDDDSLAADMERLSAGEPLQYVLGAALFYGRSFSVAPGVLIPRPETELMVEEALRHLPDEGRALDLCTGSGCIAWSLQMEKPGCSVTALDISEEALRIAGRQFPDSKIRPQFVIGDVLGDAVLKGSAAEPKFDIIVSNPPYIMESEKAQMRKNVLEHEPALALFVSDSDPLLFYRAVARWASEYLVSGGFGMVEINEQLGEQTAEVFSSFRDVRIIKDLAGKDRFITFTN